MLLLQSTKGQQVAGQGTEQDSLGQRKTRSQTRVVVQHERVCVCVRETDEKDLDTKMVSCLWRSEGHLTLFFSLRERLQILEAGG